MILTKTTDIIEVILAGAITTNQLQCVAEWRNAVTSSVPQNRKTALTNSTTAVSLVGFDIGTKERTVTFLSVYNSDTVDATVIIRINDNGTYYIQYKKTLAPGESLQYTKERGFFFDELATAAIWGDITGTLSDQLDLQAALDLKLDASAYNEHFKGVFLTLVALQSAYPTALAGDYAQVDPGSGTNLQTYAYDLDEGWVLSNADGSGAANTDALPEGSSNLYYTDARFDTRLATKTTANLSDSTNKRYVTDADLTTIGNQSGTNTGDETITTILSKLGNSLKDVSAYKKADTTTYERWYSSAIIAVNSTTAAFAKDRIIYIPFIVSKTITIDRIGVEITGAGTASSVMRLGIYDDVNLIPTNLILDSAVDKTSGTGLIACDSATVQSIPINKTLTPGLYWLCMTNNSTANVTMRTHASNGIPNVLGIPSTFGASPLGTALRSTVTYTSLAGTADLTSVVVSSDAPIIAVRLS